MIEFVPEPAAEFQVVRARGVITGEEVLAIYASLVASPNFRPEQNVLLDISGVERFDFGYEIVSQIDAILRNIDRLGIQQKTAIVAPADHLYAMARMFGNLRSDSPQRVEVFRNLADAEAWLTKQP